MNLLFNLLLTDDDYVCKTCGQPQVIFLSSVGNDQRADDVKNGDGSLLKEQPVGASYAQAALGANNSVRQPAVVNDNLTGAAALPNGCSVHVADKLDLADAVKLDQSALLLARHLRTVDIDNYVASGHSWPRVMPRGLNNCGNWCYLNATLQLLLHCGPLFWLFHKIAYFQQEEHYVIDNVNCLPITQAFAQFVRLFQPFEKKEALSSQLSSLIPDPMYSLLKKFQNQSHTDRHSAWTFSVGVQEDADEFISCLLDGLNEELSTLMLVAKMTDNELNSEHDKCEVDGEWSTVGSRQKAIPTINTRIKKSFISDLFLGWCQIDTKLPGREKELSSNVEPFYALALNIQADHIKSVHDALQNYFVNETIDVANGVHKAYRSTFLSQLPPVLMLHLRRIVYNAEKKRVDKLMKSISIAQRLDFGTEPLGGCVKETGERRAQSHEYALYAVLYHHGAKATGGHYTVDLCHGELGWLSVNDRKVSSRGKSVFTGTAYLVVYVRCDYVDFAPER